MLVAIVSQNAFVLIFLGYRTLVARYVAKWEGNPKIWAVTWGGAKRMGGGKRMRERTLPKVFGPPKRASGLLCRGFL